MRAFLWAGLLLALAVPGYGQGWAVPAKTPETPVPCTGCPNVNADSMTVGYKAPITTFTGRYLDSSNTAEWFLPFRTARAKYVLAMPQLDRIYFRYGDGSIASYKMSTFFSRLESGEELVYAAPVGQSYRGVYPEVWLRWDTWFNPEISNWRTYNADGSMRMTFFDVDDQGYVYVASTLYGWGIVKDDFGTWGLTMPTVVQKFPSAYGDSAPSMIAVVKGATRYFAILGRLDMWDVTDRKNPVKLTTTKVPGLGHFAKNEAGDRIAIVDQYGSLTINTGDGFAGGMPPLFTGNGYLDVTGDGTNFFALKPPAGIVVLVPSGSGYVEQPGTSIDPTFNANTIKYGDGYLVATGADAGSAWDARVFEVGADLVPRPLAIHASPANPQYASFFRNYYAIPPISGYVTPGYINMLDGTVVKRDGKTYLILCAKGIGDVYELANRSNPAPLPALSINNVTVTEGSAGTTTASFTVSLSDAGGEVTANYATADGTATCGHVTAANPESISIPSAGNATPSPSTISVAGVSGTIIGVTATLTGYSHTLPQDVDVLLVGPGGQSVVLMSDAGSEAVSGIDVTFDDAAASAVPSGVLGSGTYRPTNIDDGGTDTYTSAPAGPYGSALSVFNGISPNGSWSLYVVDDVGGNSGSISGGWSLTIATTGGDYVATSGTLTIPAGSTSQTITVAVEGDRTIEANETFFLNLSSPGNATILQGQGQATITNDDALAPPTNLVATATGSTTVRVTWIGASGAASYRVYRGERSDGVILYTLVGSPAGGDTSFDDTTALPNKAYLYKMRSYAGAESDDSNVDLATTAVYSEATLTPFVTTIRAAHFTEVLDAVNAVRTLAGLGASAFTAPAPGVGVIVRRQHLLDLRGGLDAARSALGLVGASYSDTDPSGSTVIKAVHLAELRDGLK